MGGGISVHVAEEEDCANTKAKGSDSPRYFPTDHDRVRVYPPPVPECTLTKPKRKNGGGEIRWLGAAGSTVHRETEGSADGAEKGEKEYKTTATSVKKDEQRRENNGTVAVVVSDEIGCLGDKARVLHRGDHYGGGGDNDDGIETGRKIEGRRSVRRKNSPGERSGWKQRQMENIPSDASLWPHPSAAYADSSEGHTKTNKAFAGHWPLPLSDGYGSNGVDGERRRCEELAPTYEEIFERVVTTGALMLRIVTWNQQSNATPPAYILAGTLFPPRKYHVVVVGAQECESSFAKSVVRPEKAKWEATLREALGTDYRMVRSHALQTTHIATFVHKSIQSLVSNVASIAVPTGIGDAFGNKGGIGIAFNVGASSFCFVSAHLSAHGKNIDRRAFEFAKISNDIVASIVTAAATSAAATRGGEVTYLSRINKEKIQANVIDSDSDTYSDSDSDNDSGRNRDAVKDADKGWYSPIATTEKGKKKGNKDEESKEEFEEENEAKEIIVPPPSPAFPPPAHPPEIKRAAAADGAGRWEREKRRSPSLLESFDYVFWFGDLNFRVNGTRDAVDTLLERNEHRVLLENEQLSLLLQYDAVFSGYAEGPLNFRPTYKFDDGSDMYDSSKKRRIPSWTDRILYKFQRNVGDGDNSGNGDGDENDSGNGNGNGSDSTEASLELLSYDSVPTLRTSDHRPVYATFRVKANVDGRNVRTNWDMADESKSEVCSIS